MKECPISNSARLIRQVLTSCLVFSSLLLSNGTCRAGGGPENVLLVVNPLSRDSMTIANHYCNLRQIPDINVLHLPWSGSREVISVETFRRQILQPIFKTIDDRRLARQIDYIVYSSGFPYGVDFKGDVNVKLPKESGSQASLTGLTFFNMPVRSRESSYVYRTQQQKTNFYESIWTRGFRSRYTWNRQGQRVQLGGDSYYLSVMLGYTDGRGNSVDEVIDYLRRSALADCSRPSGTIYLMRNATEIRSQTRHGAFPRVADTIKKMGGKAEVLDGVLPTRRDDVLGAVIGRSNFDWATTGSRILPGAICENLTSYGGRMRANSHQTRLSEFLRFGAAGSSGTVDEPFALQAKFPHPWIHVHYMRGASLAEAFYLSVASPYQLLIVGDPLCRPWAESPSFDVHGLAAGEKVSGSRVLRPVASGRTRIKEYRLFVDGRYRGQNRPGESFELDTTPLADGYHEIRIVSIDDSDLENQSRLILPIQVENQAAKIQAGVRPAAVFENQVCRLLLSCKGAETIHVFHQRRRLGTVTGSMGQLTIDASTLGRGPVRLTAIAVKKNKQKVFSDPIEIDVRRAAEFSAQVVGGN